MHPQDMILVDGAGSKPAYNLRTLSRALQYARAALAQYGLQRALYDGCAMAFLTQLHPSSAPAMERLLQTHILAGASLKASFWAVPEMLAASHTCVRLHVCQFHKEFGDSRDVQADFKLPASLEANHSP